jgi:hypothetical protein
VQSLIYEQALGVEFMMRMGMNFVCGQMGMREAAVEIIENSVHGDIMFCSMMTPTVPVTCQHCDFTPHSMVQGQVIPEAIQWIVIWLSPTMTVDDIAMYTNISTCSVERILAYFKQTGEVKNSKQMGLRLH